MPSLSSSALATQTFLSGVGVDTHIPYTDGGYANIGQVVSDLQYLGLTQVRDGLTDGQNGSAPLSSFVAVAQAGIHFTFVVEATTTQDLAATLGLADRLQQAAPGAVLALEGPNEINNAPLTFDGVGGLQGALNLQAALYRAVHSDANLAGVGVDYFTGYAAGGVGVGPDPAASGGLADFDNQHPYPNYGQAPAFWVSRSQALPNAASASEPAVYTETGYSTTHGVDANVQARYTLDLLFDTAREGISRTYLYDLMDAYAPGSPQGDDGYGLFDAAGAAKPAAVAIHNLTTILHAAHGGGAPPAGLSYEISGLPATGHSLALANADGSYDVVVWAEPPLWNASAGQEIAAPTETVTVGLSQAVGGYAVYDPLAGTTAIGSGGSTSTISVAVSDHPVLIELHGGGATAPATTSPAAPAAPPTASQTGTPGNDVLAGLDGQPNHIRGQAGDDSITGGNGFNDINGNQGNDTLVGRSQVGDWLLGGQGNDSIAAHSGAGAHNLMNGNLGNDSLAAGAGGDSLRGGQGDDLLTGGAGNDWLSGDRGHDTLTGGAGGDLFHTGPGMGVSQVTDFNAAEGDRVQLDAASHPTLAQSGADVVIDLGGGTQMILQNVSLDALQSRPGWLVYA